MISDYCYYSGKFVHYIPTGKRFIFKLDVKNVKVLNDKNKSNKRSKSVMFVVFANGELHVGRDGKFKLEMNGVIDIDRINGMIWIYKKSEVCIYENTKFKLQLNQNEFCKKMIYHPIRKSFAMLTSAGIAYSFKIGDRKDCYKKFKLIKNPVLVEYKQLASGVTDMTLFGDVIKFIATAGCRLVVDGNLLYVKHMSELTQVEEFHHGEIYELEHEIVDYINISSNKYHRIEFYGKGELYLDDKFKFSDVVSAGLCGKSAFFVDCEGDIWEVVNGSIKCVFKKQPEMPLKIDKKEFDVTFKF